MFKLAVFAVLVAVAYGSLTPFSGPLGATLLPKINVAPAKVTVVKQPVEITETEHVYRSVPYPVKAVAYTAPRIVTPTVYAAPAVAAAPAIAAAPAFAAHAYAAPAFAAHAFAAAPTFAAAPAFARAIAPAAIW